MAWKFSSPILATKFLPWSGNFFWNLNFGALFALRNPTKVRQNSNFKRNFHSRAETSLPKWEMRIFQANTQNPFEIKLPLRKWKYGQFIFRYLYFFDWKWQSLGDSIMFQNALNQNLKRFVGCIWKVIFQFSFSVQFKKEMETEVE